MPIHPATVVETSDLRYLDAAKLRFERAGAALRLTIEGEACYPRVGVSRLFPLSEPRRYLSLRGSDGKEIGVLVDPGALDADAGALLAEELRRRYVVPVIQRIVRVKERFGTLDWFVRTDRGPCAFTTRGLRETAVQPSPGRWLITDVDGNRYDVPDVMALDAVSRAHLLTHL